MLSIIRTTETARALPLKGERSRDGDGDGDGKLSKSMRSCRSASGASLPGATANSAAARVMFSTSGASLPEASAIEVVLSTSGASLPGAATEVEDSAAAAATVPVS